MNIHSKIPAAILLGSVLFDTALVQTAFADGSSASLSEYCDAKYRTGFTRELDPRWMAKYNSQKSIWECHQAVVAGFGTYSGGAVRAFDPSEACQWKYGSRIVHSHYGANHSHESTVHCGVSDGMRAPAGRMSQFGYPTGDFSIAERGGYWAQIQEIGPNEFQVRTGRGNRASDWQTATRVDSTIFWHQQSGYRYRLRSDGSVESWSDTDEKLTFIPR